jgi:hypothetical protein
LWRPPTSGPCVCRRLASRSEGVRLALA